MLQNYVLQVLLLTLNRKKYQLVFNQHTLTFNENYIEKSDISVTYIYDIFYIKIRFTPTSSVENCACNRELHLNKKIEFILAILLYLHC